jgi:hypothetical protein
MTCWLRGGGERRHTRRRGHGRQPDQDRGFIALRLVSNRPRHSPLAVRLWALKLAVRAAAPAPALTGNTRRRGTGTDWLLVRVQPRLQLRDRRVLQVDDRYRLPNFYL